MGDQLVVLHRLHQRIDQAEGQLDVLGKVTPRRLSPGVEKLQQEVLNLGVRQSRRSEGRGLGREPTLTGAGVSRRLRWLLGFARPLDFEGLLSIDGLRQYRGRPSTGGGNSAGCPLGRELLNPVQQIVQPLPALFGRASSRSR